MWTAGIAYFTSSADWKGTFKKLVKNPCIIAVYIGFFLMLTQFQLLLPGLVFLGCALLHIDPLLTGVSVLLVGMPVGSTAPILAAKYGGDYIFAGKCVILSTVLSLFTIPLWCLIMSI